MEEINIETTTLPIHTHTHTHTHTKVKVYLCQFPSFKSTVPALFLVRQLEKVLGPSTSSVITIILPYP